MPVGSVWDPDSWEEDAWGDGTWGEADLTTGAPWADGAWEDGAWGDGTWNDGVVTPTVTSPRAWLRDGRLVVDSAGRAILCDECPCPVATGTGTGTSTGTIIEPEPGTGTGTATVGDLVLNPCWPDHPCEFLPRFVHINVHRLTTGGTVQIYDTTCGTVAYADFGCPGWPDHDEDTEWVDDGLGSYGWPFEQNLGPGSFIGGQISPCCSFPHCPEPTGTGSPPAYPPACCKIFTFDGIVQCGGTFLGFNGCSDTISFWGMKYGTFSCDPFHMVVFVGSGGDLWEFTIDAI